MEYDKRTLIIMSIYVILGTICLIAGIIVSEIEIKKSEQMDIYGNINN